MLGRDSVSRVLIVVAGAAALVAWASVLAYESYHNPATQDDGYCASCHPGFVNRGDLHTLHVGSGKFTTDCSKCHTGSGRDNPLTMWSENDGFGCTGCHGRDYGETIEQDYRGFPTGGKPKMSGYGLRMQHKNKGVTVCFDCHTDVSQSFIVGENVNPPYYGQPNVFVTDACNSDGSEDGSPEPNGDDTLGLDNDGDTTIDGADLDCNPAAATPGETSGPGLPMLIVTAHDKTNRILSIQYGVACETTDNTIEFGPLDQVSGYNYTGQTCNIGNTGTYDWNYPQDPPSFFFLVVGHDGTVEGSYGTDSAGNERPEDSANTTCPLPQDLSQRCD